MTLTCISIEQNEGRMKDWTQTEVHASTPTLITIKMPTMHLGEQKVTEQMCLETAHLHGKEEN